MENYILLFVDTFFANLFITSKNEMANNIMISFGYNYNIILFVTILASLLACYANYYSGYILLNIYKYSTDQKLQSTYVKWKKNFYIYKLEYFTVFNVLSGIGNIVGVVSGFMQMNLLRFTFFISLSRIIFYYFVL